MSVRYFKNGFPLCSKLREQGINENHYQTYQTIAYIISNEFLTLYDIPLWKAFIILKFKRLHQR